MLTAFVNCITKINNNQVCLVKPCWIYFAYLRFDFGVHGAQKLSFFLAQIFVAIERDGNSLVRFCITSAGARTCGT